MDIQAALGRRAGVGRYTKSLAEALIPLAEADEVRFCAFDFLRRGVPIKTDPAHLRLVRAVPGRVIQWMWKQWKFPPYDWIGGAADIYHFPNFVCPPLRRGRVVVTVHDLAFKRLPHTLEPRNLKYLTEHMPDTLARADRIIAVSHATARDLEEFMGVSRDRIAVIYEGVDDHLKRPDAASVAAMRERLKLNNPYLLMVGTVEPRKNIPFLVDVYEALGDFDGDLVLAGMKGWRAEPIIEWMRNSSRAAQIRWLQYVPEEHMASLYAGAELFVFPSLYEGFGFPPLEAMLCGTPVVAANAGALSEVLADAAVLVDGFDEQTWADVVHRALGDPELRAALIRKGMERASQFTWDRCARETWAVYREVGGVRI